MKIRLIYSIILAGFFVFSSCTKENQNIDNPIKQIINKLGYTIDDLNFSTILFKDFGVYAEIIELESGHFFFCQDCNNNINLSRERIYKEAAAVADWEKGIAYIFDSSFKVLESFSFGSDIAMKFEIEAFGIYKGFYPNNNVDFSFIKERMTTRGDSHYCQCVDPSSTPCTPSFADVTEGCNSGGEGSLSCSVGSSSSIGGGGTILGTGFAGDSTSGSSCGITCRGGSYACCM